MNFQQLRYIVAVDAHRHFGKAAEHCHITQPTLSMMIHKLEKELKVSLFDRSKHPVIPTEIGQKIIKQARGVLAEADEIQALINQERDIVSGELHIGIIPTLAPYLLPLFVQSFLQTYPDVDLSVTEMLTEKIERELKAGNIDAGILVTPLSEKSLKEQTLFYEKFYVYAPSKHPLHAKKYILAEDIDVNQLWLLEEGHCFRSQIMNLCELKKAQVSNLQFKYEAGNIETLKKFVERNNGITILPELATRDMSSKRHDLLRSFKKPEPVREVSLVTHRDFIKKRLIEALKAEILCSIPDEMKQRGKKSVVDI